MGSEDIDELSGTGTICRSCYTSRAEVSGILWAGLVF